MTTEIATSKNFQERVFEKIRDQLGNLLTEVELKALLDKAIEKAFFEPRQSGNSWDKTEKPPYFVELIQTELQSKVQDAVKAWIDSHQDDVGKAIQEALGKGFFGILTNYLENQIRGPLYNFQNDLINRGILK